MLSGLTRYLGVIWGLSKNCFQKYRHGSEVELLINTATGFVSVRNVVDENG